MVPVDDRYLDVLQNLEFAVVEVYRSDPDLVDSDVERALSALAMALNAKRLGRPVDPVAAKLNGRTMRVFEALLFVCEWRMGEEFSAEFGPPPRMHTVGDLLACVQRVRKSVRWWTREGGKRGYLEFVKQYV